MKSAQTLEFQDSWEAQETEERPVSLWNLSGRLWGKVMSLQTKIAQEFLIFRLNLHRIINMDIFFKSSLLKEVKVQR